jgi:hypothetical protein
MFSTMYLINKILKILFNSIPFINRKHQTNNYKHIRKPKRYNILRNINTSNIFIRIKFAKYIHKLKYIEIFLSPNYSI